MKVLAPMMAVLAALVVSTLAAANVSRQQAAAFEKKLGQILLHAETGADAARHTEVSEGEVNSYLHFSAGDQLPVGVTEPTIGIQNNGRLNGRAIVDLDQVRRKKGTGGWLDPASYLTGRLPVTATGVLHTADGRGTFTLERAELSGVPIPKAFLQELVSFYTRTPDMPNGINIDDPFALPAEIRRIDVQPGRATIVQ